MTRRSFQKIYIYSGGMTNDNKSQYERNECT